MNPASAGTLYLVATPIGNLEDVTLRALRVLAEADLIVAEDTRRTRTLLEHYQIKTPFAPSLYQGVERQRADALVALLNQGKVLALVSDAGTPLLSDPGYPLVRAALEAGVSVVPVPGASALLAALVTSGLPPDRFAFEGAPPKKEAARRAYFSALRGEARTVILYESAHRILKTLDALAEALPRRRLAVCRELTKLHEEVLRGTPAEIVAALRARERVKGEFVVVVEGAPPEVADTNAQALAQRVAQLEAVGVARKEAIKVVAVMQGVQKRIVYDAVVRENPKGDE